jgi:adhesin HecA-like repeat protein
MSELRVDNIVSQDGSAAPVYTKGLNIGAGQTLTNAGDYTVSGTTTLSNTVVSGVATFSQGAAITGNVTATGTLSVTGGANLNNPSGIITTGTLNVSGSTSFGDITGTIQQLNVGAGASIVGVTTAASFEQSDGSKIATTGKAIAMAMVFG